MTDEQVLCKELGWFHNASFKEPGELWNLLMYMVGREDYNDFDKMLWYKYHGEVINWKDGDKPSDYLKWLLTATYMDKGKEKLLFVKLCADWCREHEKGE